MASGGGVLEQSLRQATTQRECSCAVCQKPAQSHAATVLPSSGPKRHASRSQEAQTSSLVSCQHHLTQSRFTLDGVASTYRMRRVNQDLLMIQCEIFAWESGALQRRAVSAVP